MEKILAAGASIIIRPGQIEGFMFLECKYGVAIEFYGARNGLKGNDLDEIFVRALKWVEEVQHTPEYVAGMSAQKQLKERFSREIQPCAQS